MQRLPRKIVGYGALGAALTLASSFAFLGGSSGCYGDQCVGDTVEFGVNDGEGALVTPDTWESSTQVSTWLKYTHQRSYFVTLRGLEGRDILDVFVYISPDDAPNVLSDQYTQYTLAGGNLAEITIVDTNKPGIPPRVQVHNDTCADYSARIVVQLKPASPDAGAPGDGDASLDSSTDTGVTE